jgi:hypothetical protein
MPETRSGLLRAFATGRSHDSAGGAVRAGPTGRCRRLLARLALLVPALLAAGAVPAAAQVDPIDNIQRRGTLVVGVKNDYPLFGSVNPAGQLVGLEPDLAADLARRLPPAHARPVVGDGRHRPAAPPAAGERAMARGLPQPGPPRLQRPSPAAARPGGSCACDRAATPLGPPEGWPSPLRPSARTVTMDRQGRLP